MFKLIAYTVKGLEHIAAQEIETLGRWNLNKATHKYIVFEYGGDLKKLQNLKTIDDIGLVIGSQNIENELISGYQGKQAGHSNSNKRRLKI